MRLLTSELRHRMPELYATEGIATDQKTVQAKFFTPDSNWTWLAVEGSVRLVQDGAVTYHPLSSETFTDLERAVQAGQCDVIFFGYVVGPFPEWGYFALSELKAARGPLGLPIERDIHFEPTAFGALRL